MKQIIFFLSLAAIFSGCSSDDDTVAAAPVAETPPVLVKKAVYTYSDRTVTYNYAYDGRKLSKITATVSNDPTVIVFNYSYTGDNITAINVLYDDVQTFGESFSYDGSGKLQTYISTSDLLGAYKENYLYNTDGTVGITSFSGATLPEITLSGTGKVFFEGGEVSRIETYIDNGFPDTEAVSYLYDDKNTIYKDVTGYSKLAFYNSDAFGIIHNITKETTTHTNGDPTDVVNNVYTYNTAGFPASSTETDEFGDPYTIEFTY